MFKNMKTIIIDIENTFITKLDIKSLEELQTL